MKKVNGVVLFFALCFSVVSFATGDKTEIKNDQGGNIAAGKQKAKACAACHGVDGNSTNGSWPKLAGQHANYIIAELKQFKQGKRVNVQMAPMVENLTEQDMAELAAYFSSQKRVGGQARAETLKQGQMLYRAGNANTGVAACSACHGPKGGGNPAGIFPSLWGQHADYIEKALKDFRTGNRQNLVMNDVAQRMTDEEISAVANYIQGLY